MEIRCYRPNSEGEFSLLGRVDESLDKNIITQRGRSTVQLSGHQFQNLPEGQSIRVPGGCYVGTSVVHLTLYPRDGPRTEKESFYALGRDPPGFECDIVFGRGSPTGKRLAERGKPVAIITSRPKPEGWACPRYSCIMLTRPRTAERKQQEADNKANDTQVQAAQGKIREENRKQRHAARQATSASPKAS
ncbi:hypothetical protein BDV59DRAFT_12642 [Aspergillus ambiguus]|uniref:uncharacterized protein n=1 Tax=Aspergillus ambiguus TaxID=176160 RepID=UPI003CCCF9A0